MQETPMIVTHQMLKSKAEKIAHLSKQLQIEADEYQKMMERYEPNCIEEIEGFEQFGDSLDKSTQDLLKKGKCLTELLKQFKYAPLSLDNEIISIFAGVNGYLEIIDIKK